jgi:folate-dependent phosphoribosylglycinamide formyltransferase PurN
MGKLGHIPAGALALATWNRGTLLRKLGQWGVRDVARYARAKLLPQSGAGQARVSNPYLEPWLKQNNETFRSLREVAAFYGFPVAVCDDQNSSESIVRLKEWSPDLIIFTGGNILRKDLLEVPRLGVLNVHLGLLPEVRGMSSPEWSLLNRVPVGITIHYMDAGIDTGPILQRCEFTDVAQCESLGDLRLRLIAFGIEQVGEVVEELVGGTIAAKPQSDLDRDNQFFVMHERLQTWAAERLMAISRPTVAGTVHG